MSVEPDTNLASAADTRASVEACCIAGLDAIDAGDLETARAWEHRLNTLADAPGDPRWPMLRGRIAATAGDFDAAASHFYAARQLDASDVTLALHLIEALQATGRIKAAVEVLEDVTERNPARPDLWVELAIARMISNDPAGARKAAERTSSLQPQDRGLLLSLAQIYQALGEFALAAEILGTQFRNSGSPRLLNDLARLYLHLGSYSEAESVFQEIGRADSGSAVLSQHGVIWCRMQRGESRPAFEAALDATRLDRYQATTAFLVCCADRLFGNHSESVEAEQAEIGRRLLEEMDEYAELHSLDPVT